MPTLWSSIGLYSQKGLCGQSPLDLHKIIGRIM
jgi:hypothetical protein